jgi:mono/diheme cytochrome c family protein
MAERKLKQGAAAFCGHIVVAASVASILAVGPSFAAIKPDPEAVGKGRTVYLRYCVSCHGESGQGDGPAARDLGTPVPDLTTLAMRHGGVYPYLRVQRTIEGSERVAAHRSSDMPAWGEAFKRTAGIEAESPNWAIINLTHYIGTLQRTGAGVRTRSQADTGRR